MSYSIYNHHVLLRDGVRTSSYWKAIFEVVKKGDCAIDLGSGTGILGFFALKAGAGKVYCIEYSDVMQLSKEIAQINGFKEKVIFLKGDFSLMRFPERVDVIISELLGYFAIEENLLNDLFRARDKILKDNGKMIPEKVRMFLAPVEFPDFYRKFEFWDKSYYGMDFSPMRKYLINDYFVERVKEGAFLSSPLCIKKVDFYNDTCALLDTHFKFRVKREGEFHGFAGWFDAQLSPDVVLSTSPSSRETHWKQSFFPVDGSVKVESGDTISGRVLTIEAGSDIIWKWSGEVIKTRKDRKEVIYTFEQSTFMDYPLDPENIKKFSPGYRPLLSSYGKLAFET
ncbi:MAG: methyltransferase domain-containing protein, partial [Fidelibacterota bacterium]